MKIKVLWPVSYVVNKNGVIESKIFDRKEEVKGKTIAQIKDFLKTNFETKDGFKDLQYKNIVVEYDGQACSDDNAVVHVVGGLGDAKALKFEIIFVKKVQSAEMPKPEQSGSKNYKSAARSFLAVSKFVAGLAVIVENEILKETLPVSINDLNDILRSNIFRTRAVLIGGGAVIGLAYAYKAYNDKEENKRPAQGATMFFVLSAAAAFEVARNSQSLLAKALAIVGIATAVEIAGMVSGEYLSGSDSKKGVESISSCYYQGLYR